MKTQIGQPTCCETTRYRADDVFDGGVPSGLYVSTWSPGCVYQVVGGQVIKYLPDGKALRPWKNSAMTFTPAPPGTQVTLTA